MNKPDFIIIPYQLLDDENITPTEEKLYGVIYWFSKLKNDKCTASNQTLAEMVKTSSGTIANALNTLEEKGYIFRVFADENKNIRTEIVPLIVFRGSPTDEGVHPQVKGGTPTGEGGVHPQVNRIRIYNKNNNNITNTRVAPTSILSEDDDPITRFFAMSEPEIDDLVFKLREHYKNPAFPYKSEIKKFIAYWTEPDPKSKKLRWQAQKFFEIRRRLATWLSRAAPPRGQQFTKPKRRIV